MRIPIPFTKYGLSIERRGVQIIDRSSGLPIGVDMWLNKFSLNSRTPILENIYDSIASEFSKIDLILSKDTQAAQEDGSIKHNYVKMTNHPNYEVLSLRPNALQTKSELLYTIAHQLHEYGNALVRIVRDTGADRNIIKALEPLNVNDYEFGQGYEIDGELYLKLRSKKTGGIVLLDYGDTIHLRLKPSDIFYGDKNDTVDLTSFIKIFDENLNALFNELKNAGVVNGVVEIGAGITGTFNSVLAGETDKINKQQEIIDRIKATKGGIVVLDAGEKWRQLNRTFKTMTGTETDTLMKYLYNFKGINEKIINGTATEAENEIFFNKSIMPIIERFIEELNYKALTKTARTQGQVIEYFKNPFEYMATKDLLSSLYLGAMFFSQNEVRHKAFRLPPLPGGDALMDNKNFEKLQAGQKTALKGGEEDGTEDS